MTEKIQSSYLSRVGTALSMIGSALGFGSIWRFPQQVAENGGLSFLLIYILAGVIFATPVFVLETISGQLSRGTLFDGALMTGKTKYGFVGLTALVALGVNTYYPTLLAYVATYLVHCGSQPWYPEQGDFQFCSKYSEAECGAAVCPSKDYCVCTWTEVKNECVADMFTYAAAYFDEVTNPNADFASDNPTDGWGYITNINWEMYGIFVFNAALSALSVMFGDLVMKYVIYATLIPSFIIVLGLWIYNFTLPGMEDGMSYYAGKFVARELIDIGVIRSGITQIVFAISVGTGVIPALASMNSTGDSIGNPSWIIVASSVIFGIISGCIVFCMLGYLALETGRPVSDGAGGGLLGEGGAGLIFITYSCGISNLFEGGGGATALHFFFWLMLYIMGFTSVVSLAKGCVFFFQGTRLGDTIFGATEKGRRMCKYTAVGCWFTAMVLFGLINASDYGIYFVTSTDQYVGNLMMPLGVGVTCIVFTWGFNEEWYIKNYGSTLRLCQNIFLCLILWFVAVMNFIFTDVDVLDVLWLILSLVLPFVQPFIFAIFLSRRNNSSYIDALDLSWNGAFGDTLDHVKEIANHEGKRTFGGGTFRHMAGLIRNLVVPVIMSIVVDTLCTDDFLFNYSPTQNTMPPWFALATYFFPFFNIGMMILFYLFPKLVTFMTKAESDFTFGLLLKNEYCFDIFTMDAVEAKSESNRELNKSES